VKEINGVLHFLVQGKVEPGNPDIVAVGPSVHCVFGPESLGDPETWPPFTELALKAAPEDIRFSCIQAEEGGRFYLAENEYRVVEVGSAIDGPLPDGYTWVTLRQLNELLRYGLVNVEARSLLACLSLI
jgi:dTDP-4-dehydro-6-deoxy-alpha-D-glucopyranose 2,3-dehydratase